MDPETKITEFDYEKYLNPELLKNCDTTTPEFKNTIRMLNYMTKTRFEDLQNKKAKFSKLQTQMTGLNE